MAIKAVIFDFDETLLVEEAVVEGAFLDTCAVAHKKYGIEPKELHKTIRQKARELWHKSPVRPYCVSIGISSWEGLRGSFEGDDANLGILRGWVDEYRRKAWSAALAEFGIEDKSLVEQLIAAFKAEMQGRHTVYPDAEPVLEEFKGGYQLALLSNGPADLQREKLKRSKLERYFETVVISGEIGFGKPDLRIFQKVLDQLGVGAEAAVMVGNSLNSDINGAQQAGLKSIWLNRNGKVNDNAVQPDYEICNLNELRGVLNSLE